MSARPGDDRGCVLLVDDEPDTLEALREAVEMAGCSALLASDGSEALRLLAERRPCLVIMDLVMPVMTGEELLASMRSEPALAQIPVLVSTSVPAKAPAGVPVLPKPIDLQDVWGWILRSCRCGAAGDAVR
jgi:CheY-like chemotaxis protein